MTLKAFKLGPKRVKTYLSASNPALYEVLGQTAVSKQPIDEDGLAKASEDVLKEKHRALRILQAKVARASLMTEAEQEAFELLGMSQPGWEDLGWENASFAHCIR